MVILQADRQVYHESEDVLMSRECKRIERTHRSGVDGCVERVHQLNALRGCVITCSKRGGDCTTGDGIVQGE